MDLGRAIYEMSLVGNKKGALALLDLNTFTLMADMPEEQLKEELNNGGLTKREYNKIMKIKKAKSLQHS